MLSRFDTIQDCDRQMDGRSDIYKHLATANTASIHIELHYHVSV